jgi:hypothetical protein
MHEEMFLYHQNQLSEKRTRQFEKHLQICSFCSTGLAGLRDAEARVSNTDLDAAKAEETLRTGRIHFENYLANRSSQSVASQNKRASGFSMFLPQLSWGLAAALVLVLTYSIYREAQFRNELSSSRTEMAQERSIQREEIDRLQRRNQAYAKQLESLKEANEPALSRTIVRPVTLERGAAKSIDVAFGEVQTVNLLFSFSGMSYQSYQADILLKGESVWSGEIPSELDPELNVSVVSLVLRRGFLNPGEYNLTLSGKNPSGITTITTYTLTIRNS